MVTTAIQIEVDQALLREMEAVLPGIGITLPDAVTMMMHRIVAEKSLPFSTDCSHCRMEAAREVARLGDPAAVTAAFSVLVESEEVEARYRMEAAREVARLGDTPAVIAAFSTLVESEKVEAEYLMEAARAIARLGDTEAAVYAFSELAQSDDIEAVYRFEVGQELIKLGDTPEGVDAIHVVIALATDFGIDLGINVVDYHMDSARKIANLGDTEAGIAILMSFVENKDCRFQYEDFKYAMEVITELGGTSALMSLIENKDDRFDDESRIWAMQIIAEFGDTVTTARAFIALVKDDCINRSVLESAQQNLSQLISAL